MTLFIRGKQKRVKRPPTVEGTDVDEFIRRNADLIWLHQNEMWEYMHLREERAGVAQDEKSMPQDLTSEDGQHHWEQDDDIPS